MKVSKLIHPEIILGTRGHPTLIKSYKELLSSVDYDYERQAYRTTQSRTWDYLDANLKEHLLIAWRFRAEYQTKKKPGIFYVPAPFAEAISKLDRNIPVDLLPERFFGYFAFADGAMFDEKEEVQGAYVFVGPSKETCLSPEYNYGGKVIWITYVCKDSVADRDDPNYSPAVATKYSNGNPAVLNFFAISKLLAPVSDKKISELLGSVPTLDFQSGELKTHEPKETALARGRVFRTLINLALYVNSIDADLVPAPLTSHLSNRQKSERRNQGKPVNECTVPVTLVSWNYQHPKNYSVDSTWIDTYMRWQRCGTGNKQGKLIWVTPHDRHFKKDPLPSLRSEEDPK